MHRFEILLNFDESSVFTSVVMIEVVNPPIISAVEYTLNIEGVVKVEIYL